MRINVLHNKGDRCAVVRIDHLVLTVSHVNSEYEVLAEIDRDEYAAEVPVTISTASGESVEWSL